MARTAIPLNDNKIKKAKPKSKVYKLFDGNGLYLEIKPNGKKIWRIKYRLKNKEKTFTIGEYPIIGLKEARDITLEVKNKILKGIDPVEERKEKIKQEIIKDKKLFSAIVEEFFKLKEKELSKNYISKLKRRAEIYILPFVGNKEIDDITKGDIVNIINNVPKIETSSTKNTDKNETARRVFMLIKQIYKFALHNDYTLLDTPNRIDINAIIPKKQSNKLKAIIDEKEVKVMFRIIKEDFKGYDIIKNALIFLALTALRPGNVRNLKWEYIDWDKKVIIYPKEAMKIKEEFRMPLTDTLIEILKKMQNIKKGEYVFYSLTDYKKMISDNTLNIAHKRLGFEHNAHGWRSSFSTICYEKQKEHGFSYEVIETQLAHKIGNSVTRAYMRSDFLEERRELLKWWERFFDT